MTMAKIDGTNGGDTLYGTSAADTINGLGGNDTLKGFGGADRIDGGLGIDSVFYGDFDRRGRGEPRDRTRLPR